jgi:hypothetical protein
MTALTGNMDADEEGGADGTGRAAETSGVVEKWRRLRDIRGISLNVALI